MCFVIEYVKYKKEQTDGHFMGYVSNELTELSEKVRCEKDVRQIEVLEEPFNPFLVDGRRYRFAYPAQL